MVDRKIKNRFHYFFRFHIFLSSIFLSSVLARVVVTPAAETRPEQRQSANQSAERIGAKAEQPNRPWRESPYAKSSAILGVEFDTSTRRTLAQGSDIWPITWADDDHQYAAWGDGGGFGGSNRDGRVSVGVARIEGPWNGYRGINVWGGKDAENPATFTGKGTGILCVGGVLAMWVAQPDSLTVPETWLAVSVDHARTWRLADWHWTMRDRLFAGSFL